MLLFAGGEADSQLRYLIERARLRGIAYLSLLHSPQNPQPLVWDIETGLLTLDGVEIEPAGAFVRQDVFRHLATKNPTDQIDARAWKVTIDGWLLSRPDLRRFNAGFAMRDAVNKPLALLWAREAGLQIPHTMVHASLAQARHSLQSRQIVYKPVAGGDECRALEEDALDRVESGFLPRPYIFQERLVAPELRIYRAGDRFLGFEIEAPALDYRTVGAQAKIKPVQPPAHLLGPLRKLTDRLGLDYAAADFKAGASSGSLMFLEVNSNPMFAGFDKAADGALCDAMLDWLSG